MFIILKIQTHPSLAIKLTTSPTFTFAQILVPVNVTNVSVNISSIFIFHPYKWNIYGLPKLGEITYFNIHVTTLFTVAKVNVNVHFLLSVISYLTLSLPIFVLVITGNFKNEKVLTKKTIECRTENYMLEITVNTHVKISFPSIPDNNSVHPTNSKGDTREI